MKLILKMLKDYKKRAILGPVFKLLEAVFELCIPLIVARLIDYGISNNDKVVIIKMCILLIVFPLIGLVFSITAQYFSAYVAVNVAKNLRHNLFCKIQSLSYKEYDTLGSSSLITSMTSDVNQVQTGVNLLLRILLRSPIIVLGATIMALLVNFEQGLIFLTVTLLLSLTVYIIMKISIPMYTLVQKKVDKILKTTRENLAGNRVIRAFNYEQEEVKQFTSENLSLTKTQVKVGKISALLNPITYVIINLAIIILLYTGAIKVNSGILTQGKVIAINNYMALILVELLKLANLLITLNKSVASSKRIDEIMATKSSLEHIVKDVNKDNNKCIVSFKNVSLKYNDKSKAALKGITFEVMPGEMVGIIGPTGSGKTSLINLIGHFYDSSSGEVFVDGENVKSVDNDILRSKIGYVPQKAVLFSGTIRENICWGKDDATTKEIEEAIELAQAKEVIDRKENGLDSLVTQEGKNFSGGQRQRLTIARAIVRKPSILILDDATSALDFLTESKIRRLLRSLDYNPTIFIVSQRTSSIKYADKIIVLDNGDMVGYGKHEELLNTCEVYREIHYSQVKEEDK